MSKLTRKSFRRKKIILGATCLAGIGLVSTGFAAWVLSTNANQSAQGNVNVAKVETNALGITIDSLATSYISFDAPSTDNTGRLRYSAAHETTAHPENLTVVVSGNVTGAQYLNDLTIKMDEITSISATLNASVARGEAQDLKYLTTINETAEAKWYGAALSLPKLGEAQLAAGQGAERMAGKLGYYVDGEGDAAVAYFRYEVGFAWGSFFGNQNPSVFYDTTTGMQVSDADMMSELAAFKKTLTGSSATEQKDQLESVFTGTFNITIAASNN